MEGIERIKALASEIKDPALLEIVKYLLSKEDMNEKYLNEEKSLKQMITYIRSEAKKVAKDGMAMIKDDVVFGWAIHYFDETNEQLGLIRKEEFKENTQEQTPKLSKEVQAQIKSVKKEIKPEGALQLNIFDILE